MLLSNTRLRKWWPLEWRTNVFKYVKFNVTLLSLFEDLGSTRPRPNFEWLNLSKLLEHKVPHLDQAKSDWRDGLACIISELGRAMLCLKCRLPRFLHEVHVNMNHIAHQLRAFGTILRKLHSIFPLWDDDFLQIKTRPLWLQHQQPRSIPKFFWIGPSPSPTFHLAPSLPYE